MDPSKTTATRVGILFLIATAAGVLSFGAFLNPILTAPDYLILFSARETQVIAGVLLVLVMTVAVVMIPVMMFPILRRHHEALALGYVVFRLIEAVTFIAMARPAVTMPRAISLR